MADAKQCDRCKKFYSHIDLCDECIVQLNRFLDGYYVDGPTEACDDTQRGDDGVKR